LQEVQFDARKVSKVEFGEKSNYALEMLSDIEMEEYALLPPCMV